MAGTPERLDRPFSDPLVMRLFPELAVKVEWGLGRIRAALAGVGDPQESYPTLHVGGTNGKGSVAATLAAVLSASGLRTGLYTSPHLCSFAERVQVDGAPVPRERLVAYADEVRPLITRHGLTFFEAATLLGLHAFAREGVEAAVIEVGLGGRLDATNVVRPLVAAVTNIALDHAEYLGGSLESIAAEKGGIAKPGVPLVTGEAEPGLRAVLETAARERGAELHPVDVPRAADVEVGPEGTTFFLPTSPWGPLRLRTPLVGTHQAANVVVALAVLERLPVGLRPDAEAVRAGVAGVRWPGRNQIERAPDGVWLFDVAHNPAGVDSLGGLLDGLDLPRPRVAVVGVLADKDWRGMLPPIRARVDRTILTLPPSAPAERRWDPVEVAPVVGEGTGSPVDVVPELSAALAAARAQAGDGTVVVTGSCHTVGDALRALGRCPFPDG